ncbi:MAG: PRC-barrel domain-containing protein [Acidobacteriota bacterium]
MDTSTLTRPTETLLGDKQGPGPRLMTANTLEGNPVLNRQGDTLGKISEIMLDVPRGRIAYAVMSSGGFLGMGDKLFALPWKALTLDTVRKCFVMDADKARFENAPGFDKDHWPTDAGFDGLGSEIHRFWGTAVYWE